MPANLLTTRCVSATVHSIWAVGSGTKLAAWVSVPKDTIVPAMLTLSIETCPGVHVLGLP